MKKCTFISILIAACSIHAAFGQTQLVTNGGFELPNNGEWQLTGFGATIRSSVVDAHSGSGYLSMGTLNSVAQGAYQTITIPTNTVAAFLTYYFAVVNTFQGAGEDNRLSVSLIYPNTSVATNVDVELANGPNADGLYHPIILDVTSLVGQTLRILFHVDTGVNGVGTAFKIDDVSLLVETTADVPVNDYFTNRTAISGSSLRLAATNTFATKEAGEPSIPSNPGGRSLWWRWTAASNGVVSLNTSGSTFNTLLAVYTGTTISSLTRIASDNGVNEPNGTAQLSFPASAGNDYEISVDGYRDNQGNVAFGAVALNLSFVPDTKGPTVVISAPASGVKLTNSTIVLRGTARDNVAVAQVQYRLENAQGTNDFQPASGTTTWSATITNLAPGLNTVRVRAIDTSGLTSTTASRSFSFVLVSPLTLTINLPGTGTVSPNYNNKLLEIGKSYTVTALPARGYVFSNWVGTITSLASKLTFSMQSNMVLQANFVPNPFTPVKGTYAGLFYVSNGLSTTNSGFFSANLTDKGSFSAKLQMAAATYTLSGQFPAGGTYSNSIIRKGQSPLSVQLQVSLVGSNSISGTVSQADWIAPLNAFRAVFSKASPAPQSGKKYNLAIPGGTNSTTLPGGVGFGSIAVDASGNLSFSGALGDGTKVTQRTIVSAQRTWPFYASLYSGKGEILGWLQFGTNQPNSDVGAPVVWIKLAQPSAKLYPAGFALMSESFGSLYAFAKNTPVLNWTAGELLLEDGGLSQSITNPVTLGANNKFTGPNKLSITLTTSTGQLRGSVLTPPSTKPLSFNAAILQNRNAAYGYFLGASESGSVLLQSP